MRIVMMVLRNLFCVPGLFLRLLWLSHHYNGDYNPGFLQCKKIAAHAIKGGNIKAEIYNVENLPKEDGFILYPNHQGLFDTLMFFYSSPRPLAFVIKKEAKDIVLNLIEKLKKENEKLKTKLLDILEGQKVIKEETLQYIKKNYIQKNKIEEILSETEITDFNSLVEAFLEIKKLLESE